MSDEKAWCNDVAADLIIDFGESVQVCAIETRGYNDLGIDRFITLFYLQFSEDDSSYSDYQENSSPRVRKEI